MSGETILLVEDDAAVRKITARMLHRMGMEVVAAGSGAEALQMLDGLGPVHLLMCDVVLPGMSGMDFVLAFLRRRPEVPHLFVTGWFMHPLLDELPGNVLAKPFHQSELEDAVLEALAFPRTFVAERVA